MAQNKKQKTRARTLRRAQKRRDDRLAAEREKLFLLEPGGQPQRPVEVASASLVELRAASFSCPTCDEALRVHEHSAETHAGIRLRKVDCTCPRCGNARALWFRIVGSSLN